MMASVTLLIVSCILIQPCISAELKFKPQSQGGESAEENAEGVHWALIVAGSKEYDNYRHQVFCAHKLAILNQIKSKNIYCFEPKNTIINSLQVETKQRNQQKQAYGMLVPLTVTRM